MKIPLGAIVTAIICVFIGGVVFVSVQVCSEFDAQNRKDLADLKWAIDETFKGNHQLYSMSTFTLTTSQSQSHSSWFILSGNSRSSSSTADVQSVRFSWERNGGDYGISELPFKKVRFHPLSDTAIAPYCTFEYDYAPFKMAPDLFVRWYDSDKDELLWVSSVTLYVPESSIIRSQSLDLR